MSSFPELQWRNAHALQISTLEKTADPQIVTSCKLPSNLAKASNPNYPRAVTNWFKAECAQCNPTHSDSLNYLPGKM